MSILSPNSAAIVAAAAELAEHGVYLFFKQEGRFRNPLVKRDLEVLLRGSLGGDSGVNEVIAELASRGERLGGGIYSPVPIARGLEQGESFDVLLERFRYEMVVVDSEQEWWWQGRPVAPRLRRFFTEHLGYEADLDLYYFEYRVNEDWWDKCYFGGEMTPMVAHSLREREGSASVHLNNGEEDNLALDSLRLDCRERLFGRTDRYGEALFSDTLRFSVLKSASEDCQSVRVAGVKCALRWPEEPELEDDGTTSGKG